MLDATPISADGSVLQTAIVAASEPKRSDDRGAEEPAEPIEEGPEKGACT